MHSQRQIVRLQASSDTISIRRYSWIMMRCRLCWSSTQFYISNMIYPWAIYPQSHKTYLKRTRKELPGHKGGTNIRGRLHHKMLITPTSNMNNYPKRDHLTSIWIGNKKRKKNLAVRYPISTPSWKKPNKIKIGLRYSPKSMTIYRSRMPGISLSR